MTTIARMAVTLIAGLWLASPASADPFFFSTGTTDGLLGALSQPAASGMLETETADDFILNQATPTTRMSGAPRGRPSSRAPKCRRA